MDHFISLIFYNLLWMCIFFPKISPTKTSFISVTVCSQRAQGRHLKIPIRIRAKVEICISAEPRVLISRFLEDIAQSHWCYISVWIKCSWPSSWFSYQGFAYVHLYLGIFLNFPHCCTIVNCSLVENRFKVIVVFFKNVIIFDHKQIDKWVYQRISKQRYLRDKSWICL